jgi:hypothetical protein
MPPDGSLRHHDAQVGSRETRRGKTPRSAWLSHIYESIQTARTSEILKLSIYDFVNTRNCFP